ncbi:AraC family transcriptional regulator [Streptomyces sp. TRM66268-LWL]|uniref:AraC family transcriptional regulator n=1 Tax=Streptomyces polyasparticus TaxID=2767826 RepID=A0ABR7SNL5_9ACTN|nr:helix-turn-helix domain-containing protein [Streptomyces polyasparticus]MBC9716959.1 AraC family transcriptional regulator [Streptomyces polyasparticus]
MSRCPAGTWERAIGVPHPRLRPGVLAYRGFRLALPAPRRRLETPVPAVTLLLGFDRALRVHHPRRPTVSRVCAVSGLATTAVVGEHDGRLSGIEVMIAPWAAFTLFGLDQHELADQVADPDDALPAPRGRWGSVDSLADALGTLPTWSARFALLDEVLTRWSEQGSPSSPRTVAAWNELVRTSGAVPVAHLAEQVGWSVRQLENRFREQIGLSPKAAARVLRLTRARRLLAAGRTQAETAAACGFYDQSHLSGEFRAMTGFTPGEFTAARRSPAVESGPPNPDRLQGEATSLLLPANGAAPFSKTAVML